MSTLVEIRWPLFFAPLFSAPLLAEALNTGPEQGRNEPSDEQLMGRAQKGDPRAMQDLYQRHAPAVYRRLTHLVGPDPEREDLLQEVFIALFRNLGSFRGEARLKTYLCRIAANKACDHLKKRIVLRRTAPLSDATEQTASAAPSPERRAQGSEDAALFWRCLDDLTPKKRIALVLRVVEGLTLKEIAEQVDASVHTVAQRIRHAKMELVELVRQNDRAKNTEDDR